MNLRFLKKYKLSGIAALLIGASTLTACNDFLDINENPNNPDTATPELLLPTVEASISQIVGNSFQVYGNIWGQYWTQNNSSSQYKTYDQYNVVATAFDRPWSIIYRNALNNAQLIIDSEGYDIHRGAAYLLKAYTFQVATDAFGDIPVQEALLGSEFRSPSYESQEAVYDAIFSYIEEGKALLASDGPELGNQDMIFRGDVAQWEAFANTLTLRAYLRLSEIAPDKAKAGIEKLYQSKPVFLTEDATITYTTTGGNENPLYNEMVGLGKTQNVVASGTAVKAFVENNDPRVFAFFEPVEEQDTIAYLRQGGFDDSPKVAASTPSALVGALPSDANSAVAPVKLFSEAESYFLQAEAVLRGWAAGDAKALYESGVKASFMATGFEGTEAATYLGQSTVKFPDSGTPAKKLEAVITQKYFAMCGFQGFEAWTEWRRTGYPMFFVESVGSV
ncbi:MAG: SusD/RagB family nutrient-binding outer membrane lipoprotein, partial [Sphingobacterium sp.]